VLVLSVFSDNISAFGAFLVGVSALASSLLSLRGAKRRARDECDQRIQDIRDAFKAGIKYEPRELRRKAS